ncbi:MAG TPA: LamB/YcsF family protein, partial [Methylibium sp.]
ARSILLHGDTPGAVALARTVRSEIEAAGGRIVPVSRLFA